MLRTRVMPTLLLRDDALVKTVKFSRYQYVGDPCNAVRIFNELEVDELFVIDILATSAQREPNYALLQDIASECFMPLAYGGGVSSLSVAKRILNIGYEKILINTSALQQPALIKELSDYFGSQAVIVSIDVKNDIFGRPRVWTHAGRRNSNCEPVAWAREAERLGAGEILLTRIEREGTWGGFDISLVEEVSNAVGIPVVAHGGAGCIEDIGAVVKQGKASAVALGSMVTFQKKGMGVLINYPDIKRLEEVLK